MNRAWIFRYRVVALLLLVALSIWQAYLAFYSMFDLSVSGVGGRFSWIWLMAGPTSFFLASSVGTVFAFIGMAVRTESIKRFWNLLLLISIVWLGLGSLLFIWSDWFGANFKFSTTEHLRHFILIFVPMVVDAFCLTTFLHENRKAIAETAVESAQPAEDSYPPLENRTISLLFRWLGALTAAGGSILAVFVCGLMLLLWGCEPPSVSSLAMNFPGERKELEAIIAMLDQDAQMAVIDPTWLELQGQNFPSSDKAVGISEARWNEYRRIFRRNGITQGIRRYASGGDAFIIVKSFGMLNRGYSNGYLYCVPGADHNAYLPCSSKEQRGKQSGTDGYEFIKLTDRWYAYREGTS